MKSPDEYQSVLNLLKARTSVRRFKPDPIPEGHIDKVLEAGRWAMSGANSQPWEFIVVKDPGIKAELLKAYKEINTEFIFWMEQQRLPELRHPSFQVPGTPEEQLRTIKNRPGWEDAPVLIVVLGDGRKQWGTVMGAHTFGRGMTHLTDGLANACQIMHLAAAALGLGSQWVTIHVQEPFKRILGVPATFVLHVIMPLGYPAAEKKTGHRRPLSALVHYDRYDMNKYLPDAKVIDYLYQLRENTKPKYAASYGADKPGAKV